MTESGRSCLLEDDELVDQEWVCCYDCGSRAHTPLLVSRDRIHRLPGRFQIVRCQTCGLVYQNPRLTPRAMASHYPANYPMNQFRPAPPRATLRQRLVARQLSRMDQIKLRRVRSTVQLGPQSRVLDVGCAIGSFLAALRDQTGCEVVGVEPAPEPCRYARERFGLEPRQGLVEELAFEPHSFDLVTMWHVMEHQWDPRKTLRCLRRLLKPEGTLLVEVPNYADPLARLFRSYWSNLELPRHLIQFTPRTIRRMLESCGFAVDPVRRGGAMPPYSVFLSSLMALFGQTYEPDLEATAYVGHAVWYATWPLFRLEGLLTGRGVMTVIARPDLG